MCGEDKRPDHPFLFISDLSINSIDGIFKSAVCVDKCPGGADEVINCIAAGTVTDCKDMKSYKTTKILTYCFPKVSDPKFPEEFKKGWAMAL